jgi:hypothetical protein
MVTTRRENRLRSLSSLTIIGLLVGPVSEAHKEQDHRKRSIPTRHAIVQHRLRIEDLFRQIKQQIGSNREEISSWWGNPDSVIATAVKNLHVPEVIDSVLRLFYEGLQVAVYKSGYDHREFLTYFLIEENHYLGEMMPQIGAPVDSLVAMLGAPDERGDNIIKYQCDDCESGGVEFVVFHVRNASISGIEFNLWIE